MPISSLMNRTLILTFLATAWSTPRAESAVGVDTKVSTLGVGIDITLPLTERVNARLGLNSFNRSFSLTEGGIDYDADLDLDSTGLFVDWHPFAGTFRLTAGYVTNDNAISGRATGDLTVGGTSYTGIDLRGAINFDSGAYLGVGWGNTGTKGWAVVADIGLLYQGAPNAELTDTTGTVSSADLNAEAAELESGIDDYDIYPVLGIGISYTF